MTHLRTPACILAPAWKGVQAGHLTPEEVATLQRAIAPRCVCGAVALASIDPTRRPLCAVCAGAAWVTLWYDRPPAELAEIAR